MDTERQTLRKFIECWVLGLKIKKNKKFKRMDFYKTLSYILILVYPLSAPSTHSIF